MQGVIIVSHRGPYTFVEGPDGDLIPKRGAGGVVSALGPLLHGGLDGEARPPTWIAAAIGAGERAAARREDVHLPGVDLALLDLPEEEHRLHYDVVSNEVLWFLHHGIFDHIRTPSFAMPGMPTARLTSALPTRSANAARPTTWSSSRTISSRSYRRW